MADRLNKLEQKMAMSDYFTEAEMYAGWIFAKRVYLGSDWLEVSGSISSTVVHSIELPMYSPTNYYIHNHLKYPTLQNLERNKT